MARTRKQTPTIPAEIPAERPPRKRKPKAVAEVLEDVPGLTTAAALATPEVAEPEREYPTFEEKLAQQRATTRPIAPRKRDGEPAASFASAPVRITLQDRVWQVEARRELTGNEKDRLAASGFHAVDDNEQVWNAPQSELVRRGTDVNVIAFELSGKAGRGR